MILYADKKECCGCGACAAVCSQKAIEMVMDPSGFSYPQIHEELCIECGKCKKACSFQTMAKAQESKTKYLAKHNADEVLMQSTSGGMFSALSEGFLENGGAVYAADLCEDMTVRHVCITSRTQRDHARGSKYVQSDMSNVYSSMRERLRAGQQVIFFGTPCQVGAVRSAIAEKEQAQLYTVDLICNGVGSPMVWQQHVAKLQKKFGKTMNYYWFRPKTQGYLTTSEVCQFQDGSKEELRYALNQFNFLYYSGLTHRPACTACQYAAPQRVGDITIGDFSRAKELFPDFDSSKGASMVLCNTDKGEKILAQAQEHLLLQPVNENACDQIRLHACAQEKPQTAQFLSACAEMGLEKALKKELGIARRIKIKLVAWLRGVRQ